ncbi:GNAT family N-acetyltransferase [Actinopolymorpha sp. B17G11]|uniref:bifunctional acetate--CoA ligase family protein/GNAT family N-acetyltransferase n=1 Tax=Actinopolymorpha sp. B17G11 TaxID=3160861 RepID=UPI0032E4F723
MRESESSTAAPPVQEVRAALTDGRIVVIRPLGPADLGQLRGIHAGLPERDRYFRFFTARPAGIDPLLRKLVGTGDAHRLALGGFIGGSLLGVAHYETLPDPAEAEVALVVDHHHQAHGLGTLLLEHLASAARSRGVRRFVAEVFRENAAMVRVFHDLGLPTTMHAEGSSYEVAVQLVGGYPSAVGERERRADVASLRTVLRPRSVAVVGASRRSDAIGHAVLANLRDGFGGACYAVNRNATSVNGLAAVATARDLPSGVDLAVLCVPPAAVAQAAEDCGVRGVRALVVITSGLDEEQATALKRAVRSHGMRLVGPNCLGVANTDPDVRLNATFASGPLPVGRIGIVTQSGGVGIALLEQFRAVGLGISTLVSTGDKYDVSSNDLLMWWHRDDTTDLAVVYVESFGNPRKFAKVARALAERKPVLALRTGRTEAAQRAAASHTAATATPVVARDALFDQAGVISVDSLTQVLAVACMLSWQLPPQGNRVAVIGNVGGIGVLAADAAAERGLSLPELGEQTRATLGSLLPPTASLDNPVDTTAGISDQTFHTCVRTVLDDPCVDIVLVLAAPTALVRPDVGLADSVAGASKPVLAVRVGQTAVVEGLRPTRPTDRTVPAFGDPAVATDALQRCARYGTWRVRPPGTVPDLPGIDIDAARALVDDILHRQPAGCWLDPDSAAALLGHFGLPLLGGVVVTDPQAAVAAFHDLGHPVAMKAIAENLQHKTRGGGVALAVADETRIRTTFASFRNRFGPQLRGVLIQPMAEPGRELLAGLHNDPTFGPLVAFGLGGVDTDLLADRAYRLVPMTSHDAEEMIAALRASPMLFDPHAIPRLDTEALADVLLRVSRLGELLPEVAELDLNPVIASEDGCRIVDARIRVGPAEPVDPYLRRLRA